jgi:hypothetical protein
MSRLHRTRHLSIRQQTSVINAIRAHLAELKCARSLIDEARAISGRGHDNNGLTPPPV